VALRRADDLRRDEASCPESSRVDGGGWGGGGDEAGGAADLGNADGEDLRRGFLLLSALLWGRAASFCDVVERGRRTRLDVGRGDRATTSLPAC